MAHDILGQMYAGRESAWHNLGIVGEFARALDAINAGGMDWRIEKLPVSFHLPDGTTVNLDGSFGLWREPVPADPIWRNLSGNTLVSADYTFWQNNEIADRIDLLTEETGWKFSTAGILDKGATIFICLDMGDSSVAGEEYKRYFTYIENRNGKSLAHAIVSRVRVVCRNTCNLALRTASGLLSIAHRADYLANADWAMGIMADAERAGTSVDTVLNQLAEMDMDADAYSDMLTAIAPMPSMQSILTMPNLTGRMKDKQDAAGRQYEMKMRAAMNVRDAVTESYNRINDTIAPNLRGKRYTGFQAVTEFTTHTMGTLGTRGRKMSAASRAEADLMGIGQDMRNRAALSLIGDL